ncbi:hypothetical protein EC912_102172 [Luteibacter rhizovicinus]|uniref:Uncharacterized protein n=1 Tax=Luteibacter rhizovicinus TaxID=242606 RepID=A0A4R3YSF3_9GAMM|nr:hypothetical protein [Luteibacter rhizovicinus]TCV95827.1 hypothetical protein EC912_102172 [Luteibacter rhizovicinus]
MIGVAIIFLGMVNVWYLIEGYRLLVRLAEAGKTIGGARVEGSVFSNSDRTLLMKLYFGAARIEPDPAGEKSTVVRVRCLLAVSAALTCGVAYIVLSNSAR